MAFTVYGLVDPEDRAHRIRYVGCTLHAESYLPHRLACHVQDAKRGSTSPRARWIRSLLALGRRPAIVALEARPDACDAVEDSRAASDAERRWIASMGANGRDLLNKHLGGIPARRHHGA